MNKKVAFHLYFRKATILFSAVLLLMHFNCSAQKSFDVDSTVELVDAQFAPYTQIQPGDTIYLTPGNRSLLILRNFHGTVDQPIIITNKSGIAEINSSHYFGISIRQSSYIRLTGTGDKNENYGIKISNIRGSGLSVGDYTTNFELDHIEIYNPLYAGIVAKTEPDCDFDRASFIQVNTVIHDCYIHNSGNEGMYIGSSFYNGQTLNCNGSQKVVLPPLLKNVSIYNNRVEYSGWDGIQVSSAVNVSIKNNTILYDSQAKVDWQMTGIILGEGSTGVIANNFIKDGEGTGIFTNGLGDIRIYNNIILNPGKNNNKSSSYYGMYLDDGSSFPGMYFYVYNNLIVNPHKEGIRLLNNQSEDQNLVANNIIIKQNFASTNDQTNDASYLLIKGNNAIVKSNILKTNSDQLFFSDYANDNFNLKQISPAVDAGSKIIDGDFLTDFYGNQREQGYCIDIGPVESGFYKLNSVINDSVSVSTSIFPNPVSSKDYYTIHFNNLLPGNIDIKAVDLSGKIIKTLYSEYMQSGNQEIVLPAKDLREGMNYIEIIQVRNSSMLRIYVTQSSN